MSSAWPMYVASASASASVNPNASSKRSSNVVLTVTLLSSLNMDSWLTRSTPVSAERYSEVVPLRASVSHPW